MHPSSIFLTLRYEVSVLGACFDIKCDGLAMQFLDEDREGLGDALTSNGMIFIWRDGNSHTSACGIAHI